MKWMMQTAMEMYVDLDESDVAYPDINNVDPNQDAEFEHNEDVFNAGVSGGSIGNHADNGDPG